MRKIFTWSIFGPLGHLMGQNFLLVCCKLACRFCTHNPQFLFWLIQKQWFGRRKKIFDGTLHIAFSFLSSFFINFSISVFNHYPHHSHGIEDFFRAPSSSFVSSLNQILSELGVLVQNRWQKASFVTQSYPFFKIHRSQRIFIRFLR